MLANVGKSLDWQYVSLTFYQGNAIINPKESKFAIPCSKSCYFSLLLGRKSFYQNLL